MNGNWVSIENTDAEIIPSFALAKVTGVTDGVVTVGQPDTDNSTTLIAVGMSAIPVDGTGIGTYDTRVILAYEEADGVPTAGQEWGSAAGSWKLRSGKTGFVILGGAGKGLVNAIRSTAISAAVSAWKPPVRAASTANGTLATAYENGDTLDGVTLATGDRILLKDQTTATENGIYTVNASGTPTRATDADTGTELLGAAVVVTNGTTNADTAWLCTTNATITLGSTNLTWTKIGFGDVYGPSSSVDGAVAVYNSTTGKIIKMSPAVVTTDTVDGDPASYHYQYAGEGLTGASDPRFAVQVYKDGPDFAGPQIRESFYTDPANSYGFMQQVGADTSNRATQYQEVTKLYDGSSAVTLTETVTATSGAITMAYSGATVKYTGTFDFTGATVTGIGATRTEGTLAAAGSTSGDAAAIPTDTVEVTGADGTKGVKLPNTTAGLVVVWNNAASALKVYPPSGASIGTGAADVAQSVAGTLVYLFTRLNSTNWSYSVLASTT